MTPRLHLWLPWNRMDRCARLGCGALRKGGGGRWYRMPKGQWVRERPECLGEPSTNKA